MPSHLASVSGLWWEVFFVIGGGTAAVVALAAIADRSIRSALWQRTIWRAASLALLAILVVELTGAGAGIVQWFRMRAATVSVPVASPAVETSADTAKRSTERLQNMPAAMMRGDDLTSTPAEPKFEVTLDHETVSPAANVWWPGVVWMIGAAIAFTWIGWTRVALAVFRHRCHPLGDEGLRRRVDSLAQRLGLRRPVRILVSARLDAPVVFGALRPVLVLSEGFAEAFDARQQEAILAHELAHLAGRDSSWMALASMLVGLLWWHPLVWWSKRRLHAASEAAADEASRIVPDGPCVLAESLVLLGQRLLRRRSLSWLSVEGNLRSGLGRRVERLLRSESETWRAPRRGRLALAHVALPIAFTFSAVFCMAWAQSQVPSTRGETTMGLLKSSWKSSLAATALCAILASDSGKASAQERSPGAQPPTSAAPTGADRDKLRDQLQSLKAKIDEAEKAGKHDDAERLKHEAHEILSKMYPGRTPDGATTSSGRGPSPADLSGKIQHLRAAAENLKAAGFDQEAQHISQMIERLQAYANGSRPSGEGRSYTPGGPYPGASTRGGENRGGDSERAIQELHGQLQAMQHQMQEMQEQMKRMSEKSSR